MDRFLPNVCAAGVVVSLSFDSSIDIAPKIFSTMFDSFLSILFTTTGGDSQFVVRKYKMSVHGVNHRAQIEFVEKKLNVS